MEFFFSQILSFVKVTEVHDSELDSGHFSFNCLVFLLTSSKTNAVFEIS